MLTEPLALPASPPKLSAAPAVPPEVLVDVASYFGVLAEPTRLQLLNLLRQGECSVGELAQRCGLSSANVSRHLSLMAQHGLVGRQSRGTSVYYQITDDSLEALCNLVCSSIGNRWQRDVQRRTPLMGGPTPPSA